MPPRPERWLYCPRCGAKNQPDAEGCEVCHQDLRLVGHAVRQRQTRRRARPSLRVIRLGAGLTLLLLVAGAFLTASSLRVERQEQEVLRHYLNGVWAAEVERWDLAVTEFGAAGSFRDAPQRRAAAAAQLAQAHERYEEAVALLRAGQPWDAAFLLNQIETVLPDNAQVRSFLREAQRRLGPMLLVREGAGREAADSTSVYLASPELGESQLLAADLALGGDASFSPSGEWLTYEGIDDERTNLWLVNVATGEQTRLVGDALDFRTRWNPDGHSLLVGWQGTQFWRLAVHDLRTGDVQLISEGADFAVGDFDPTGRWYTLWERRSNRWTLLLGRSGRAGVPRPLVEEADAIGLIEWSPSGSELAYGYFLNGQWRLYMASSSRGAESAREVAPGTDYSWLAFSPLGRQLVLWHWQAQIGTLFLREEQLEQPILQGAADAWVRWAPTGEWLTVGSWNGRTWALELRPVSPGAPAGEATVMADGVDDGDASFAPGGRYVLYRIWQGGLWRLVVRDLRSGEGTTLLAETVEAHASWAPDGQHLLLWWRDAAAGASPAAQHDGKLAIADAATGRRVLLLPAAHAVQGGFSKDGSKLAFAAQPWNGPATTWVANPDGSGLLELDRESYRIYWATAPFEFGPRLPGPLNR